MVKRFAMAAACVLAAASVGYAGSVDTYGIGSRATALGGAYAATADDPFAAYYNPAGLSQIEGKVFSAGVHVMECTIELTDFSVDNTTIQGESFELDSEPLVAPHLGYAQRINDSFSFGVAAYAPWGLELEWEDDPTKNPGAYSAYHSYYKRYGVTPTLSYKLNDKLAFGFGVTLGKSEAGADAKRYLADVGAYKVDHDGDASTDKVTVAAMVDGAIAQSNAFPIDSLPGAPPQATTTAGAAARYKYIIDNNLAANEAQAKQVQTAYGMMAALANPAAANQYNTGSDLNGVAADIHNKAIGMELEDDFNVSYNIGVMYNPTETVTLGLAYRSECEAEFEGDVLVDGVKKSSATMDYNHPQQIQFGVRYQPHSKFHVECDLVWTDWSINQEQVSVLNNPNIGVTLVNGIPVAVSEESFYREWEDTKQLRFGAEYIVNDLLTVRAGYFYDPTPIPDDTLDLQWADADKKVYTLGAGLNFGRYTVDTVFQYTDIEKARVIGGESKNLNHSFQGNDVNAKADGHILGFGVTLTTRF